MKLLLLKPFSSYLFIQYLGYSSTLRTMEQRAINCLLSQAIGDALGTRYEFRPTPMATKGVTVDMADTDHLPMLGKGPFHLLPGQVTDDTELALALARCLVKQGKFNIGEIARAYQVWYHSPPFDIGLTTMGAFDGVPRFLSASETADKTWQNSKSGNSGSLSNGCLMRISPLGIAGSTWDRATLLQAASEETRLTNPHAVAQDAVGCYAAAIACGIRTGNPQQAYAEALDVAKTPEITKMLQEADVHALPQDHPGGIGYLGIALHFAFHELLHGESFEKSMISIMKHGGDTDTNGCIAAALLGSCITDESAIPSDWIKTVLECKPSDRLGKYPWADCSDLRELALQLLKVKP